LYPTEVKECFDEVFPELAQIESDEDSGYSDYLDSDYSNYSGIYLDLDVEIITQQTDQQIGQAVAKPVTTKAANNSVPTNEAHQVVNDNTRELIVIQKLKSEVCHLNRIVQNLKQILEQKKNFLRTTIQRTLVMMLSMIG
jgi:hypothetical protein